LPDEKDFEPKKAGFFENCAEWKIFLGRTDSDKNYSQRRENTLWHNNWP
jgi:hypothetical protein